MKVYWMLLVVLTCNSMMEDEYSGERPNELSGSWFPLKCLSGQRLCYEGDMEYGY